MPLENLNMTIGQSYLDSNLEALARLYDGWTGGRHRIGEWGEGESKGTNLLMPLCMESPRLGYSIANQ